MSAAIVARLADYDHQAVENLLARYGLQLVWCPDQTDIPGSYWGEEEAGLRGCQLLARGDTPLHSILHEASHFVCMDGSRRAGLDTDAGGDYAEENAVCYLQILLADLLPEIGREGMCRDMDAWGYTFRLGSAGAWFARDADDARLWLQQRGLINTRQFPTFRLRDLK